MEKLTESDAAKEMFEAISENVESIKGVAPWTSSVSGDQQPYRKLGGDEGSVTYAVNIIRSTRWPGATTLAKNDKYFFIYIGDGIKRGADFFSPTQPPDVEADPSEPREEPEPNGKEPEEKKEEDEEEDEDE